MNRVLELALGSNSTSLTGSLLDVLDHYSNLIIAIFTVASVGIALFQLRQMLRGSDVKCFPASDGFFIGPTDLVDHRFPKSQSKVVFFDVPLVLVNRGPKAGAVVRLKLGLLYPKPDGHITRATGEIDDLLLEYRFANEEAINAPLATLAIEGNSATTVKPRCAIVKTNLSPANSPPPVEELTAIPLEARFRLSYQETHRGKLAQRSKEFEIKLHPAFYGPVSVDKYREFLKM